MLSFIHLNTALVAQLTVRWLVMITDSSSNPGDGEVVFVVDKAQLQRIFSGYSCFSPSSFHQHSLQFHPSLSTPFTKTGPYLCSESDCPAVMCVPHVCPNVGKWQC